MSLIDEHHRALEGAEKGIRYHHWSKVQAKWGQPLPAPILRQKEKIAELYRLAELFVRVYRVIDMSQVYTIVEAKLELDRLYGAWIEGEL